LGSDGTHELDVVRQKGGGAGTLSLRLPASSSRDKDNSVTILLTSGSARVLLTGDAEKKPEECMSNGPHADPLAVIKAQKYKTP